MHPPLVTRRPLLAGLLGATLACGGPPALGAQEPPAAVIMLVRHAEKADDSTGDPALSAVGERRAKALAALLADVRLDRVLSTDYVRTRATAAPVAASAGVSVESYDPERLEMLAAEVRRAAGQRILVVGHSNTTPRLVELLGGEPGPPIAEAREYDRLYVLTIPASGPVTTVLLRFGPHSPPRPDDHPPENPP